MKNGVPRILIIRLSAIGDVVRVLPALHTLREAYPNAQIDWAVERKSADIVKGHPSLDETLVFERPEGIGPFTREFLEFCRQIRRNKYDIVMDFHGILKSGLIMAWSGAQERYGFARPRAQELSWLFSTDRVKLPSMRLNRVKENLMLCEALKPGYETTDVTISVPLDIQDEVNSFFDQMFEGGKIVVALHAPVDREEKQWPIERFAELADLLIADGRFEVMLTWGPGQFEQIEKVLERAHRNPVVAPETANIKQYAWLVHRAGLHVGGDTGPMHIAAAMGTPVVAIFGGTDPAKHAPYKRPCKILYPDGKMSPEERLDSITPEVVYDACISLVIDK